MIKNHIELKRDGERKALLTWHKRDEEGNTIPIAMEFADDLDAETIERITAVCARTLNARENGQIRKAFPGTSVHFEALPKVLEVLGFRVRQF